MIKREWQALQAAFIFFTRIPIKSAQLVGLTGASRYLPFIGMVAGLLAAGVFLGGILLFNDPLIAAVLSLLSTILLTGGFHEDGLADVADAFGGGWTKEKILEIMKDSRVGTFGVLALIVSLGLKVFALAHLLALISFNVPVFILISLSGHAFSRVMPLFFLRYLSYSRDENTSKVNLVATKISAKGLLTGVCWGLLPLMALGYYLPFALITIVPCTAITIYLGWYFQKWIGGYTGDCLGATQQINEIIFYLTMIIVCRLQ